MKTKKMTLANIQGKLSRGEMKNVMAGFIPPTETCNCNSNGDCGGNTPCCVSGCTKSEGYQGVCHIECA